MTSFFFFIGIALILAKVNRLCKSKQIAEQHIQAIDNPHCIHIPKDMGIMMILDQLNFTWMVVGLLSSQWLSFLVLIILQIVSVIFKMIVERKYIESIVQIQSIVSIIIIHLITIRHFFPGKI